MSDPDLNVISIDYFGDQPADIFGQIQGSMMRARDRQTVREIAELIDPDRVFDGSDGSVWLLASSEPGERRGWQLWP